MSAFSLFNAIYFRYSTSVLAHSLSHNKNSLFCLILFPIFQVFIISIKVLAPNYEENLIIAS